LGLITVIILTITGIIYIQANTWPKSVPNGDIFFQSGNDLLNFIKSDGSEHQELILKQPLIKPVWSADGKTIIGLSTPRNSYYFPDSGYPAYWDITKGKNKVCANNQPYYFQIEEFEISNDKHIVLLNNYGRIVTFNLDTCRVVNILIDYEDHLGTYDINGFSYRHSSRALLFGRIVNRYDNPNYQIIKYDLSTGTEELVGEGLNPSWSPDGSKIAYIGPDGIYVTGSSDPQGRLLIKDEFANTKTNDLPSFKPLLRWSPDGNWIVVHHCNENMCFQRDAEIRIIRVSDGFQETIFVGGFFPALMP
jgi:Tol biopolymer transport system component